MAPNAAVQRAARQRRPPQQLVSWLLEPNGQHGPPLRQGLAARKLIPTVPNAPALDACGAPSKTLAFQVISKSVKPAATTVDWSSASSRAPAIQPVQRSTFFFAPSGTSQLARSAAHSMSLLRAPHGQPNSGDAKSRASRGRRCAQTSSAAVLWRDAIDRRGYFADARPDAQSTRWAD